MGELLNAPGAIRRAIVALEEKAGREPERVAECLLAVATLHQVRDALLIVDVLMRGKED